MHGVLAIFTRTPLPPPPPPSTPSPAAFRFSHSTHTSRIHSIPSQLSQPNHRAHAQFSPHATHTVSLKQLSAQTTQLSPNQLLTHNHSHTDKKFTTFAEFQCCWQHNVLQPRGQRTAQKETGWTRSAAKGWQKQNGRTREGQHAGQRTEKNNKDGRKEADERTTAEEQEKNNNSWRTTAQTQKEHKAERHANAATQKNCTNCALVFCFVFLCPNYIFCVCSCTHIQTHKTVPRDHRLTTKQQPNGKL